jgi:hypothetical protein
MSAQEDTAVTRPDPFMTYDGAFFWKAADEGRFVARKCNGCAKLWHPPRAICPDCLTSDQVEQELSGRGKVVSWVQPIHPLPFGFTTPPIVVIVETEEGLHFVSNLEGVPVEDIRIDMPVKVGFTPTRGGRQIPIFHADEER